MKWTARACWFLALSITAILAITLIPGAPGPGTSGPLCLLCGRRGLADFILNVALFAPFGAALGSRVSMFRVAAIAALFSTTIELAQIGIVAGRDANFGDLLANTLGAAAGWQARRGWRAVLVPDPPARYAIGAVAAAILLLLAALAAQAPSLPRSSYHSQWTARFAHMDWYLGRVLESRIGGLNLAGPPWRIAASDSVRTLLLAGARVEIVALAGPAPEGLAPLFSIYDDEQREVLLVGVHGYDLVYRHRLAAHALRLDGGDVRVDGALASVSTGDTLRLTLSPTGPNACVHLDGRERCGRSLSVGSSWMLLYYLPRLRAPARTFLGALWLGAMFFPAGLALGRAWRLLSIGAPVVALILVAPPLMGTGPTPYPELFAVVAGLVLGHVLGMWFRRPAVSPAGGGPPPSQSTGSPLS